MKGVMNRTFRAHSSSWPSDTLSARVRQLGNVHRSSDITFIRHSEMQAPAWLPANAPDTDPAAPLRSNGRCRSRRIPGMAARQTRQQCSLDSNSDRSAWPRSLDSVDGCEPYHDEGTPPQRPALRRASPSATKPHSLSTRRLAMLVSGWGQAGYRV